MIMMTKTMTITMTMTVVDDDCLIQSPVELSSWTNSSKLRKKSWLSSTSHIILLDIIIILTFPINHHQSDLRLSPGWLSSLRAPCHRRPAGTGTRPHAPPSLQTSSHHWLRRQSSIISFHFCVYPVEVSPFSVCLTPNQISTCSVEKVRVVTKPRRHWGYKGRLQPRCVQDVH